MSGECLEAQNVLIFAIQNACRRESNESTVMKVNDTCKERKCEIIQNTCVFIGKRATRQSGHASGGISDNLIEQKCIPGSIQDLSKIYSSELDEHMAISAPFIAASPESIGTILIFMRSLHSRQNAAQFF